MMSRDNMKGKRKMTRDTLFAIFLEEAKRIMADDRSAKDAAEEALQAFSKNHPDMVEAA